jgi:biotin-[acetyl-CoA-carboxylase] ligase BirA-like protein
MQAPLRWVDAVGSTQDAAHELAAEGAPHGTAIAARVQTAGRGTRRRQWISSEGGLWLSVVCRPRSVGSMESVSLRVGLVLATLLERWIDPGLRVAIKWPNDLLLGGRKTGGVLAEARWQGEALGWLVIGVGINLHNPLPSELTAGTRLGDHGCRRLPEELAPAVAAAVAEAGRTGEPLTAAELRVFEGRDWLRGRRVSLPHEGVAIGISGSGRLRIRTADSAVVEALGTVALADQPA